MDLRVFQFSLVIFVLIFVHVNCVGKYSEELNVMEMRKEEKPFRMQKLNAIWSKARKKLSAEKLKLLDIELKIQDKDELTWKRLKAEGQDKDGLKEAELRKKLRGIMNRYDLNDHFEDTDTHKVNARSLYNEAFDKGNDDLIFKDKKLSKLWIKAERAGFSEEELKTLKEEFQHHQEKLNEYYQFIYEEPTKKDMDNSVDQESNRISEDYFPNHNQLLKEKHRDIKSNYDRLGRMAALGPDDKDFEEHKVKELWNLVLKSNFSQDELDSLKEELKHYEHRVKKLQHLQSQVDLADASNKWGENNLEDRKRMEQKVKQYSHKINKIHVALEGRIMQRHSEL